MNNTNRPTGKWLGRIMCILLAAVLCVVSFLAGGFMGALDQGMKPYVDHAVKAENAFEKTNLAPSFEITYVLHGSNIGRDMYSQTVFEIPYLSDREELLGLIQNAEGWHVETITADDYRDFVEITWYPSLVQNTVSNDIVFDAWFYRETCPSAGYERMMKGRFSFMGQAARGFEFAVYDEDTGLFIFIDQHG